MRKLSRKNKMARTNPLKDPEHGHILTQAIIDTIQEPLIVLDEKLRIIAASRSFYKKFGVRPESTQGKMFYSLGNGQWDIPPPQKTSFKDHSRAYDHRKISGRT